MPERGGQPGNLNAVKSGAYSRPAITAAAEKLRPSLAKVLHAAPWVQDVDLVEVDSWVEAEALKGLLMGELMTRIAENHDRLADKDRWLIERVATAQGKAQAARSALLLNPASRRKAGRDDADITDVLAAQREVGARLRAAHGAVLDVDALDPDDDDSAADDALQPEQERS